MRIPSYLLAVLMLGIVSQIAQVVFLREMLMVFHGSELSIGLILAAWMAWAGIGARLGAAALARINRPLLLVRINAACVLLTMPLTIFLIRTVRTWFAVMPGAYLSLPQICIACCVLMAPAGLLLGSQFVLLARLWRDHVGYADTTGAAWAYMCESFGNMAGGIIFTFLAVHYLNSFQTAVLAAALMCACAAALRTGRDKRKPPHMRIAGAAIIVLALTSLPLLERIDHLAHSLHWERFAPQYRLVETRQSKHGIITVVQRDDQFSFFQSGHLIFSTAGRETPHPELEELEATVLAHSAMVQNPQPRRVLLIGGGLQGMVREIIKHPVGHLDYVELDDVLSACARGFVPRSTIDALDDPRVRLIHTDGRLFVKSSPQRYDLIIVHVPDPATAALNRFYTYEFFKEAGSRLADGGVFIISATSTSDLRGSAIANRNAAIYHSLDRVFDRVLLAGDRLLLFIATDAPDRISVDPAELQQRYLDRAIDSRGFSGSHFYTIMEPSRTQRLNWMLHRHGRSPEAHLSGPAPGLLVPRGLPHEDPHADKLADVKTSRFINSDFRPLGYFYTLMLWEELTAQGHHRVFARLLRLHPGWLLPAVCLPLLIAVALRSQARRRRTDTAGRFAVLFTIFTTGFSTMALQIALLFSFQSIYGFVYEMIGMIVAVFMGGLALGTGIAQRFIKNRADLRMLARVQAALAIISVCIGVALPICAGIASPAAIFTLFSLLTLASGLINGIDFPLATACYMSTGTSADRSAGAVYGMELLGACIGAALASVIIAPIFGIVACCLVAGLANTTACGVLSISRRYHDKKNTQPVPYE